MKQSEIVVYYLCNRLHKRLYRRYPKFVGEPICELKGDDTLHISYETETHRYEFVTDVAAYEIYSSNVVKKAKSINVYKTTNLLGQQVIVQVQYGSTNAKTGDGVQIWILPYEWILIGKSAMNNDEASCLDCPHSKRESRKCYVRKGNAEMGLKSKVNSLHTAFVNGRLNVLPIEELASNEIANIQGKFVRFGAYGEPVLLGEANVIAITNASSSFTGYTHQWRNPSYQWASKYLMASVETEPLMNVAHRMGWRTFRVMDKTQSPIKGTEISCPASKEMGSVTTCNKCGLCKGTTSKGKSIAIILH